MKELIAIQSELHAPKGQYNKFGGFSYRSCEDILEALKPLLLKYKCYVVIRDEIVHVGERFYINANVTFINEEGKSISTTAFAREADQKKGMDESQITGSASSYARKYALNGMFLIDDVKDADTRDNTTQVIEKVIVPQPVRPTVQVANQTRTIPIITKQPTQRS